MSSRDQILQSLRTSKPSLPSAAARPSSYLPVTAYPDGSLQDRFKAEVERLTGKVYFAESPAAAMRQVITIIGKEKRILTWQTLPLSTEPLHAHGIEIFTPDRQALQAASSVQIGLTGADAGFATTGTIVLVSQNGQERLPSLLPPIHIVLLALPDLYPRLEDWMIVQGHAALLNSRSVAFVTGPSRTSDIEMQTIIGVHGPRDLLIILYIP